MNTTEIGRAPGMNSRANLKKYMTLTDNDLMCAEGKKTMLSRRLNQAPGKTKDEMHDDD